MTPEEITNKAMAQIKIVYPDAVHLKSSIGKGIFRATIFDLRKDHHIFVQAEEVKEELYVSFKELDYDKS